MSEQVPEIFAAPAHRRPDGEVITSWNGPPRGGEIRDGREREFRRAERLMAVGIAQIRSGSPNFFVARRCFHAAMCLYTSSLGAERRVAFAWDRLGYTHHCMGNQEDAETCYLRSLAVQQQSGQERTGWNEVTLLNLDLLYRSRGRRLLGRRALAGYPPARGTGRPDQGPPAGGPACRTRPIRHRPKRGYTSHGLRTADVVVAFVRAEQELGGDWRLKGRGHCRRVTLDARYSRLVSPEIRSWIRMTPHGVMSQRTLFPRDLVRRAAQILSVRLDVLVSREY